MSLRLTPTEAQRLGLVAPAPTSKFRVAQPDDRTYQGSTYHSAAEANVAWELDCAHAAGENQGWQRQVPFPLHVHGQRIGTYVADFVVEYPGPRYELLEVKGYGTALAKWKWKHFQAEYGAKLRAEGWTITMRQVGASTRRRK